MSGDWDGSFSYPGGLAITPFRVRISDKGGRFSGSVIEPDLFQPERTIGAEISGHRQGRSVDFTKTYIDPVEGYENPVDYVGQLSGDGMVVSGVWSLFDMNGTFEMHREEKAASVEKAETAQTVPASGMLF